MSEASPRERLEAIKKNLSESDRSKVSKKLDELALGCKGTIEKAIATDLAHLQLVSLCINPFTENSTIGCGYLFIRTDPLLSVGEKIPDVLLYHSGDKLVVLVECKSSVADPRKEVGEILSKVETARRHKELLEQTIGDTIGDIEFVVCVAPEFIVNMKEAIRGTNEHVCLWSANALNKTIFLIPIDDDKSKKPWERGTHRNADLTSSLIDGLRPESGSVRIQPFLATSNMGIIVSELFPRLALELMTSGSKQFVGMDVLTLVERLLPNHERTELERISSASLDTACHIGIVTDDSPGQHNPSEKSFSFAMKHLSGAKIQEKYVKEKAQEAAREQIVEEIGRHRGRLRDYIEPQENH